MASVQLGDIETEIRSLYDCEGFEARHPQAAILRRINSAYVGLRERATREGSPYFLTPFGGTATEQPSQVATLPGDVLTCNAGITLVSSVAVQVGSRWLPLRAASLEEAYAQPSGATGIPSAWAQLGVNSEGPATATEQHANILVWPRLDAARVFRGFGLAAWNYLTSASAVIWDEIGARDYVIAAVGVDLAIRDDDVALYERRTVERERAWAEVSARLRARIPNNVQRVNMRGRTQ